MKPKLEQISESQVQQLVDMDEARYERHGGNTMIITTDNQVYWRSESRGNDYIYIGMKGRAVLPNKEDR